VSSAPSAAALAEFKMASSCPGAISSVAATAPSSAVVLAGVPLSECFPGVAPCPGAGVSPA
jgi:hypothetical protein